MNDDEFKKLVMENMASVMINSKRINEWVIPDDFNITSNGDVVYNLCEEYQIMEDQCSNERTCMNDQELIELLKIQNTNIETKLYDSEIKVYGLEREINRLQQELQDVTKDNDKLIKAEVKKQVDERMRKELAVRPRASVYRMNWGT